MSCIGCGQKEVDKDKERAIKKAKEYAEENQTPAAIYRDERGKYQVCNAFIAAKEGYPIIQVVSRYNNPTT